jgi:aminoglycoside phosphotransferase (APT) family kinase protein
MARMHADELDLDEALVHKLISAQFPQWAALPVKRVPSTGTDNAMFRMGEELAARLPRRQASMEQIEKEHRWLPQLAPLPLEIPVPVALGEPAAEYPWRWSLYRWLGGENAAVADISDERAAAVAIARFIHALRAVDPSGGPSPGTHNFGRGVPLSQRDARVRASITSLSGEIDEVAVSAAWQEALDAPPWSSPPVWIHGDLQPSNLLVRDGHLTGVIDFGGLAVGDPACDLMLAWNFFTGDARAAFKSALRPDDAAWARGRGWALSMALMALPYYMSTNPAIVKASRLTIEAVLSG